MGSNELIGTRAMAKLGHPDGEVNLTKGAANTGIVQIVSYTLVKLLYLADYSRYRVMPLARLKKCQQPDPLLSPCSSSSTSIGTVQSLRN